MSFLCLLVLSVAPAPVAHAGGELRAPATATPPLPPPRPAIPDPPAKAAAPAAPSTSATTSCLAHLRERGAVAEVATYAQPADPRCTVADPVKLTSLTSAGARVEFPDQPVVACTTAETFADFLADFLVPLVKGTFDHPLGSIGTGPGFECRPRNGIPGEKLSAHGQGLALDIAQLRLSDGRVYDVGRPVDDRDRRFDRAVRAGACGYFHTALGPGADEAHAHHWHMDLEPRGANGFAKFCQ